MDEYDVLWQLYSFAYERFAPIEILWTLIAIGGIWFARRATRRAQRTIDRLKGRKLSGPLRQLAERNVRKSVNISLRMAGYIIIGCVALAGEPHPVGPDSFDVSASVISGFVLVAIEFLDVGELIWDEVEWRNLIHDIRITDRDEVVIASKSELDEDEENAYR